VVCALVPGLLERAGSRPETAETAVPAVDAILFPAEMPPTLADTVMAPEEDEDAEARILAAAVADKAALLEPCKRNESFNPVPISTFLNLTLNNGKIQTVKFFLTCLACLSENALVLSLEKSLLLRSWLTLPALPERFRQVPVVPELDPLGRTWPVRRSCKQQSNWECYALSCTW
jgi:hypothetical protein